MTFLGYYSRLFLVPKKTGDLRPVDIRDAYLHVPMHKAVRKYLRFVVNKQVYHFTCLPFGLATSPREFTKLLRLVLAQFRQRGVKLHVYLDVWRIRAILQNRSNCMPRPPSVCSSSLLDHQLREVRLHSKSGLPVYREAVQHSTVHSSVPAEDASRNPVCSPTLDDQSKHHSPRSAQISGHGGVLASLVPRGRPRLLPVGLVVGRHSMVPEDRRLVRPDHSSSVGSVRGGLMGISSSPTRSSPRHQ